MCFSGWEVVGIGEWFGRLSLFFFGSVLVVFLSFMSCEYDSQIKDGVLLLFSFTMIL